MSGAIPPAAERLPPHGHSPTNPQFPDIRVNWFDRHVLLRGRDPWRPVTLVRFERLRWALLLTALLAVLGAGLIAWTAQQRAHDICVQRNENTVTYREALGRLADVADERGDHKSALIFRALEPHQPLPRC